MSDTFRKTYKTLKLASSELITKIKVKAEELEMLLNQVNNREMAVAKTNVEQGIMWATKAVVLKDELDQLAGAGEEVEL